MASPHRTTGSLYPTFRTWSTCMSHSQAPLCYCTPRTVTIRAEGTFGKPPLLFWRRPPQSNYPPSGVPFAGLELKYTKGRISTSAPRTLACPLQSLRPILHIVYPNSALSYSKGSRGLFRPVAGTRHHHRDYNFTELTVETVSRSLHHSCRSELTRQRISLP